jgi:transcriptional regulator
MWGGQFWPKPAFSRVFVTGDRRSPPPFIHPSFQARSNPLRQPLSLPSIISLKDFETKPFPRRIYVQTLRSIIEWSTLDDMPRRESPLQSEMPQGTLDMLILRTLVLGPAHGHTIAHAIERRSEDVLQVEHGSLYPALHRLEDRGWIASFWGASANNRKAKYYRLTPAGRKQLSAQTTRWEQVVRAIGRILKPATE